MSLSTYHVLDIVLDRVGTKEPHKKYLGKLYMEKITWTYFYAIITINNSHISPNPNYLYRKNKNLPYRR